MRIAIVGSGISGLVAAHLLQRQHEISVFEAEPHIGGHTRTVEVSLADERHAIDTGFIVYNERTYPHFSRLLGQLGVATRPTEMSFGVSCERSGLEWASHGLRGVFAQPSNGLRPSFLRMLRDVLRFNRESRVLLGDAEEKVELGDYLCGAGYSQAFVEHYLLPMGAAIWSADPATFLRMPAVSFVRFFENHGLLRTRPGIEWRVVRGGSARYVERLVAPFRERIRVACPVRALLRRADAVELATAQGLFRFDQVVLAVHSDQALRLLRDATPLEARLLRSIAYQENEVVLHTDERILPRRARARASWNTLVPREPSGRVLVTYDMNRLQGISSAHRFLVTLNGSERIDPGRVLHRFVTQHPVFDAGALAAQRHHAAISGRQRTHFCGAYWGHGFHEDGVRSALAVCAALGVDGGL
jgi:predicted NAD/FAD-binding protein